MLSLHDKMKSPSSNWSYFDSLHTGSDQYMRNSIQNILSSANFEYLEKRAIESRRQHQPDLPPHLECSINLTHFAFGCEHLVLELAFSDQMYWVACTNPSKETRCSARLPR